jgi:hypothetical protein
MPWIREPIIDPESLKRFVECEFYFVLYHHITVHNKTDSKTDFESQHKLFFPWSYYVESYFSCNLRKLISTNIVN